MHSERANTRTRLEYLSYFKQSLLATSFPLNEFSSAGMSAQKSVARTHVLPVRSPISADSDTDFTAFADEVVQRVESDPSFAQKESRKNLIGRHGEATAWRAAFHHSHSRGWRSPV